MIDLILFALTLYGKYIIFFLYLSLLGRGSHLIFKKYLLKKSEKSNLILETRAIIFYPIIGTIILGNVLLTLHYFIKLNNKFLPIIALILLLPNFLELKLASQSFTKLFSIQNMTL